MPDEFLDKFLEDDKELPKPGAILGEDDSFSGQDSEETSASVPPVDELLGDDPDAKAVYEAFVPA